MDNKTIGSQGFPPTQLANRALAILGLLPPGSGVCPIGTDPKYPWPTIPAQVRTITGGYADYYNCYPVDDASGLMAWTGPDSVIVLPGLDKAQQLAQNVLAANTANIKAGVGYLDWDYSAFLDFNPKDQATSDRPYVGEPKSTFADSPHPLPWIAPSGGPSTTIPNQPLNIPSGATVSGGTAGSDDPGMIVEEPTGQGANILHDLPTEHPLSSIPSPALPADHAPVHVSIVQRLLQLGRDAENGAVYSTRWLGLEIQHLLKGAESHLGL